MRFEFSLVCGIVGGGLLCAQVPTGNSDTKAVAENNASRSSRSSVDQFRELLTLKRGERERALAQNPKRLQLLTKLDEYDLLPPGERDARLQLIELHLYLVPLMKASPSERGSRLAEVPDKERALVQDRLKQWDRLPADLQKNVLDHELTIHYFLRLDSTPAAQKQYVLAKVPANNRKPIEDALQQWHAVPSKRQQRMYEHFQQFFELPPSEREKTLGALKEPERQQMEKSLQNFEKLPQQQRQTYLESFQKFAKMSSEERSEFLKNAERWQEMTPRERETWRALVTLLPPPMPPMPPGFKEGTAPAGLHKSGSETPSLPGSNNPK